MTSQPDNLSGAAAGDGPFDYFDDVVATQGAYLMTHPGTPVLRVAHDDQFIAELKDCLRWEIQGQRIRRSKYHEAADEWRAGYTPPEVRVKHEAEFKALLKLEGFMTDEDSDNENVISPRKYTLCRGNNGEGGNEDKSDNHNNIQVGPEKLDRPIANRSPTAITSGNVVSLAHTYSQDCFDDVVTTRGAYLVTYPGTPVFQVAHDDQFVAKLTRRLHMTLVGQRVRKQRLHEAADEWRAGYTPPEVRKRCEAELKALLKLSGFGTDDSSDNDSDGRETDKDEGGGGINAQVGPGKPDRPISDSSPTAMTSSNAIPSAHQYSQGSFDVVATQGAYLVTHPGTPVLQNAHDYRFVAELKDCLEWEIEKQQNRRRQYREAADEWRARHTPPEVREKCNAELKALLELEGFMADDDSDKDTNVQVGPEKLDRPISDSSPTAMTSRNAIPSAHQYSQGSFDVVATQGAYLLPHPRTPVFQKGYDEQFAARLEINLRMVIVVQEIRRHKYGEVADEFRRGYTPPEAREKREAELKAMAELWERSDSSDNDSDGCEIDKYKGGSDSNAQVGPGKPVATPDQPPRPHQTHCLPSPPSSAESSLATTHKRKRRISSDDEEEKEHPAKKQIGFAQKPNTTQ